MNRSFHSEATALGQGDLSKAPNEKIAAVLSAGLKEFSSILRKTSRPPLAHHQVVNAVSQAIGFPSWDAFLMATRRLAAASNSDRSRLPFCDALPLLPLNENLVGEALYVIDRFAKKVQGHTGYPVVRVKDALAQFWSETSNRIDESATFGLEVRSDAVWPSVVGPLIEILDAEISNNGVMASVHSTALNYASAHADALEGQLRSVDKDAPEQVRIFFHSKTLKELPWRRPPFFDNASDAAIGMAYAYWRFCKVVAGKAGTRTHKQFQQRAWSSGYPSLIDSHPLIVTMPCPACGSDAELTVRTIEPEYLNSSTWSLSCKCGHQDGRSGLAAICAPKRSQIPWIRCGCPSCQTKRAATYRKLKPFAHGMRARLESALMSFAKLFEDEINGKMRDDGTVWQGNQLVFHCREDLVHINESSERSFRQKLTALSQKNNNIRAMSVYLRDALGFGRKVLPLDSMDILELAFARQLAPMYPINIGDSGNQVRIRNLQNLENVLSGFNPEIPSTFDAWLESALPYLEECWLRVPVVVLVFSNGWAFLLEVQHWTQPDEQA